MRHLIIYAAIASLSIVLPGCGDDKSPDLHADKPQQVTTSINDVNQSRSDIITTYCTCSTPAGGTDLQKCIDDNQSAPLTLSDCQTTATTCDPDSYIAYMNCQRDALQTLNTCLQSCPDTATETQCTNTFDTKIKSCDAHITTQLSTAFQSCNSNQTPACANTPNPDPKPGNNQCISLDDFNNRIVEDSWISAYFAGSDGLLKCENGKVCLYESIAFFADQTYHYTWTNQGRFGDTSAGSSYTVCTHGTWNLQCDKLTLTDCRGETTTTIRLTNEGFQLDSRSFKQTDFMRDVFSGWDCSTRPCNQ